MVVSTIAPIGIAFPNVAYADESISPISSKTKRDNGDGTYTISLSVKGTANTETTKTDVNVLVVFDTSGSMKGEKIASLNTAVAEVMPYVDDISSKNPDAQIKIASLEFSSGCEWMYPQPMEPENYNWRDLEAEDLLILGMHAMN